MQDINQNYSNCFSERLKKATRGDSQVVISKKLKCSQQLISKYLKGEIPEAFFLLVKLTEQYQVDLNWLLTGTASATIKRLYDRHCDFTERLCRYISPYLTDIIKEEERIKNILASPENLTEEQKKKHQQFLEELKIDRNKTISDLKLLQEFPWGGNSYDDDPIETFDIFVTGGENPSEINTK